MLFISEAFAQTANVANTTAAAAPDTGLSAGAIMQFLPLIIIFVIFYALLIRPQQKRMREHQTTLDSLKKGDNVVTGGGIHGTIVKVDTVKATVEIASGVQVVVNKGSISEVVNPVASTDSK